VASWRKPTIKRLPAIERVSLRCAFETMVYGAVITGVLEGLDGVLFSCRVWEREVSLDSSRRNR